MKNTGNTQLRIWELALLLALAAAILWGAASLSRQEDLGRKVIRLHVIANSDSPEDQALKLRVRDRVLARAQELLEQSADMVQAREVLTSALPELTREAQQVLAAAGCGDGVRARLAQHAREAAVFHGEGPVLKAEFLRIDHCILKLHGILPPAGLRRFCAAPADWRPPRTGRHGAFSHPAA